MQAQEATNFREGYIKISGTKINGLVSGTTNEKRQIVYFKATAADSVRTYLAGRIDGYGIVGGSYFISHQDFNDEWVFQERLVDDLLSLTVNNGYVFLKWHDRNEYIHLDPGGNKYRKTLKRELKNSVFLSYQALRTNFDFTELIELVKQYNQFLRGEWADREKVYPKLRVSLSAAPFYSIAKVPSYDLIRRQVEVTNRLSSMNSLVGGQLMVRSRRAPGLVYYTGADVSTISYHQSTLLGGTYYDFDLSFREFNVRLGIESSSPLKKKWSSFSRAGLAVPRISGYSHSVYTIEAINGTVYLDNETLVKSIKKTLGVEVEAGVQRKLLLGSSLRVSAFLRTGLMQISNTRAVRESGYTLNVGLAGAFVL